MESGGSVREVSSSLDSSISNYSSSLSSLSGIWTGMSKDSFDKQTQEFVNTYPDSIKEQLNAYASACEKYTYYEELRDHRKQLDAELNEARSNKQGTSKIEAAIKEEEGLIAKTKGEIESFLSTANGSSLEASPLTASITIDLGNGKQMVAGSAAVDPNLTASTKYPNYVSPFANDVKFSITSHLGLRNAPTAGASSNHKGTDLGAAYGTKIHAIQGGTVENAGRNGAGGFGNWVVIRQDDGKRVIYGHVSKSDYYKTGDRVETGAVIANVGSEGVSTGPHLHLQIEDGDKLVDSEDIFEGVW